MSWPRFNWLATFFACSVSEAKTVKIGIEASDRFACLGALPSSVKMVKIGTVASERFTS